MAEVNFFSQQVIRTKVAFLDTDRVGCRHREHCGEGRQSLLEEYH